MMYNCQINHMVFLRLNVIYINFDDQLNNNEINENR